MSSITDILTTNILMPTSGSPSKITDTTIVSDLEKYKTGTSKTPSVQFNNYQIRLTSNGKTTDTIYCQKVYGLSVSRAAEKKSTGGNALYEVKLPGKISYSEVTFDHLYTNSTTFLDWLINGASNGGALFADIEIKVGDSKNGWVVYTLRDAFPVRWRMGNIKIIAIDEINKFKSNQTKDGEIPLEQVTVAYGRLDYSTEKGNGS